MKEFFTCRFYNLGLVTKTAILLLLLFNKEIANAQNSSKPNIVFIIADDLGYGNLTSYNASSKIPTPNIDAIGKGGLQFTRFYAGSTVCAPSRCALMTGKHMGTAYVRGNGNVSLRSQDTTIAQLLQANGYKTGMFGKWGLGEEAEPGAPHLKGFDAFFGYLNQTHAHHYYTDHLFEVAKGAIRKVAVDSTHYSEDLILDHALSFIKNNKDQPFFLYLPLTLPHAELRLPDSLISPFLNADGTSKFEPDSAFPGRATYGHQRKPRAAFAAMITKLDKDVGRITALLKELGLDKNTYVFFTSDNGPHKEGGGDPTYFNSSGGLRGIKRDLYEGGIRVPLLIKGPKPLSLPKVNTPLAFWDILPTICQLTGTPIAIKNDGASFASLLNGKPQVQKHNYLYWQFNEGGLKEAVMQNNWKLVRFKQKGSAEVLELYDLSKDEGEKKNLASNYANKVQELKQLMIKAKSPAEHPKFDWSGEEL